MSCDNMKPYACGGSMNPNTVQNPCDRSLHFEGADDVTINQGVGIDLTEGVHAYDAHGNEIEYTVEPESIEKCEVGDHVITYTATGEGSRSVPTMCGETALYARACNIITEIKKRIITILQSANPIISGLSDVLIQPDETFAPLSGVTAEDANGNELTVSYSGRYTNTAEGDIATFDTPYAEPMVSLVADIDPIQDLHGYDRPWVGGAGKNKVDVTNFNLSTIAGSSQEIFLNTSNPLIAPFHIHVAYSTQPSGTPVMLSVRYTDQTAANVMFYKQTDLTISSKNVERIVLTNWSSVTGVIEYIQIESGSSFTGYSPYSNICPISGWDSVDVSVCGINVWDEEWEVGRINPSTGANISGNGIRSKNMTSIVPNTKYHVVCGSYTGASSMLILYYDANGDFISHDNKFPLSGFNFTPPANATQIKINVQTSAAETYHNDICINYPSTDHEYHAYQGHTYTTDLPQTVYGGTLDVVSGVLTVDMAMVDLGTLTWYNHSSGVFWAIVNGKAKGVSNIVCSQYETSQVPGVGNLQNCQIVGEDGGYAVYVKDTRFTTDATAFKTAMDGVQLCYTIATPTTITLNPTQIDSLLGRNNVWADSGDVTVEYIANIPQIPFPYPVNGTYTITYTAEDECGNRTENDRTIQVGAETFRTVIYEDKTLIINERSSDIEENEHLHGRAEYVYDAMDNDHPYVFSSPEDVPWHYFAGYPERVEFGSEVHPTSTAYWFYSMNQVNTFDFTNLDTSNVTDMKYMFYGCEHILNLAPELDTSNVTDMSHMFERCIATPEIDVSSFDTSNVTDMSSMFASCYNLRAIYAKPTFVTDNVTSSNLMFGYDVHLVGGMGTPYDSNYEDSTYARIDDPPDEPGYFTQG